MKLASGDMLTFGIDSRGCVIQCIGRGDVPRVEREGRGWDDGDRVFLQGADMARFLDMIFSRQPGAVVDKTAGSSGLSIRREGDTLFLETDANAVSLTNAEQCLFVVALQSQVWRLFQ